MFLQFFRTLRRARQMDPLHVTMTGVRMGERFLQVGCDDPALLGGLATKVGLSGACAVAVFTEPAAARARKVGASVGALLDVRVVSPGAPVFDAASMDMVVVDDTRGGFAALTPAEQQSALIDARRTLRHGGRIEVVEGTGSGGMLGRAVPRPEGYAIEARLAAAGFKPVRALAEKDGFRFVEGLSSAPQGQP